MPLPMSFRGHVENLQILFVFCLIAIIAIHKEFFKSSGKYCCPPRLEYKVVMSGPWWFCRSLASAQIFSCISALVQRYLLTILNSNDETSLSTESGQNCHVDTAFAMPVFVIKCISVSPKQCLMQCLKFQTGCLVGVADPSRYPTQPLFQTASDQILFRMV